MVDVPFSFNAISSNQAKGLLGIAPPVDLAQAMHSEWVNFAKPGSVSWSAYDLESRPTMQFDKESKQLNDLGKAIRKLWDSYSF